MGERWLPLLLFVGALLLAFVLITLVIGMPFAIEHVAVRIDLLRLFAEDATVRRTSIAGAVGLLVTAFVFFRPNSSRKATKKPKQDTMAGA